MPARNCGLISCSTGVEEEGPRQIRGVLKRPWKQVASEEEMSAQTAAAAFNSKIAEELAAAMPIDQEDEGATEVAENAEQTA